jgi:predicted RNase H-like nuclease
MTTFLQSPQMLCVSWSAQLLDWQARTKDRWQLALGVRKLAEFLSTNPHLVEEVTNSPAGVVFNFMATMELKQKSETAENNAYSLRSNALDQGTFATTDCKWTSIANY